LDNGTFLPTPASARRHPELLQRFDELKFIQLDSGGDEIVMEPSGDGLLPIPTAPGLGISWNPDGLARLSQHSR
jgi:hypothetical protein